MYNFKCDYDVIDYNLLEDAVKDIIIGTHLLRKDVISINIKFILTNIYKYLSVC